MYSDWRSKVHPCPICGLLTHNSREVCTICKRKPNVMLAYLRTQPIPVGNEGFEPS